MTRGNRFEKIAKYLHEINFVLMEFSLMLVWHFFEILQFIRPNTLTLFVNALTTFCHSKLPELFTPQENSQNPVNHNE